GGSKHPDKKAEEKKKPEKPSKPKKEKADKKRTVGISLAPLKQVFITFKSSLTRFSVKKKDEESHIQKIDVLLDQALSENPFPQEKGAISAPAMEAADPDPFLALTSAELEDELLQGLGEEEDLLGSPQNLDIALQAEETAVLTAEDDSDEVNDILKAYESEISSLDDMGEMDSTGDTRLEGLEDVDLGALDLDVEDAESASAEMPDLSNKGPEAGSLPAAEPGKSGQEASPSSFIPDVEEKEDMLAFASGSLGSDDLISALKSDIGQVSKGKDLSLLRDLKDEKVDVTDLEEELKETLQRLKPAGSVNRG
ncbi:MAG TPA: hypothetical protein VE134_02040, partial [Methanomicrobiales archaeon]|nr:hypothetical protein [Methanomicrobiales archaeon]